MGHTFWQAKVRLVNNLLLDRPVEDRTATQYRRHFADVLLRLQFTVHGRRMRSDAHCRLLLLTRLHDGHLAASSVTIGRPRRRADGSVS